MIPDEAAQTSLTVEERLMPAATAPERASRRSLLRSLGVLGVLGVLAGAGLVVPAARDHPGVRSVQPTPELPVTAMDQGVGPSSNSPTIVADPTDARFVVLANRMDAPDFSCALQLSGDGARSWAPADPVPTLPEGAEKCYGPEVAFDREGTLYYLFVGLAGGGNRPMGIFLTTSADRGQTFTPPRKVLDKLRFGVRMAIDRSLGRHGRLHLVWIETTSDVVLGGFGPSPNPILTSFSDDGGNTFSDPVQVSDPSRARVVAPALTLGPDHNVYVAYVDLGGDARDYQGLEGPVWDDAWSLVLSRSTDGGRRFAPGVVVDDGIVPSERVMLIFTMPPPALVADRSRVCLAWTDGRNGDPDALLRCMRPGQAPHGAPVRLNDDPVGNGHSQFMPRLSLSPDGRLDAIFYDRRTSPQNFVNEVFYTYSSDGGGHFAPNVKLTSEGSDSRIGQQYANVSARGQVEWGARLGLYSRPDRVVAAWADTRNSRPNTTGQDLFVTYLDVRHGKRSTAPMATGAALFVAGGLAIGATALRSRTRRVVGS